MKTQIKKPFLPVLALLLGLGVTHQAWSFGEPCYQVAQSAGAHTYQTVEKRVASLQPLSKLPPSLGLSLLERNGAWYIYQTPVDWVMPEDCAPFNKVVKGQVFEFTPVLLNKQSGASAVIIGSLIIKSHQAEDLHTIESIYGFKMLTQLPNPRMAIFDVKPTASYDDLLKTLENDKNIDYAVPLFSEPRYRTR